jgi:Holliday junction resolvase RusA-like endonuclease
LRCKLTIPGLLPGLNEYIDAERGNKGKYKAASMKKQAEHLIGFMIKSQLRGVRFAGPVVIHYTWIEPNKRRDKDNIAFAKKFIQDSLVRMRVLENDGWKHIEYFTDSFAVDPKNPRVEVVIEDYEGGKPSALLEGFTTRQLVEELFRRIGTEKDEQAEKL